MCQMPASAFATPREVQSPCASLVSEIQRVHFVAFSTEHDMSQGSEQLQWLEADLSAASRNAEVDWIVAFAHKPLYCSTNDFNDCGRNNVEYIRPNIEPLFERYGVDLYLTGHVHNYERTWPVLNDTAVSTDPATAYVHAKAPTHVVVGMSGDDEGLTDRWMTDVKSWSAVRHAELGWARLSFARDGVCSTSDMTLKFEYVLSKDGSVYDTFTLRKSPAASSQPSWCNDA